MEPSVKARKDIWALLLDLFFQFVDATIRGDIDRRGVSNVFFGMVNEEAPDFGGGDMMEGG